MNFWEMIDRMGERRALRGTSRFVTPQFLIALILISMFARAFEKSDDKDVRNLMVGALIAAFAGAWGYFLGSSNASGRANDRADAGLAIAQEAIKQLPAPTPDPVVTLQPGEVAQAAPETEEKVKP
jgi:hypothetical protein